jgi:hypothetical protein
MLVVYTFPQRLKPVFKTGTLSQRRSAAPPKSKDKAEFFSEVALFFAAGTARLKPSPFKANSNARQIQMQGEFKCKANSNARRIQMQAKFKCEANPK